jgi:hypothetical protein
MMETFVMTRKHVMFAVAATLAVLGSSPLAGAEGSDQAALIKALAGAKVSLQQGLDASQSQGRPISGKFEIEDGRLQLSIYTAKDGKYFEVIVDYSTGKVTQTTPITEGEDLADAKAQSVTMGKARTALKEAVDRAMGLVSAARAVSVIPDLKSGRPLSGIVLLKAGQFQTVTQQLD